MELAITSFKGRLTEQLVDLETADGQSWRGGVLLTNKDIRSFTYRYAIYRGATVVRKEWNLVPRCFTADTTKTYIFPDHWMDAPLQSHLYSSVFTRCVNPRKIPSVQLPLFSSTLILKVQAPQLKKGEALALLGNQPALGDWQPRMALRMTETALHEWSLSLSANGLAFPFEYKYVVVDEHTDEFIRWEDGENRVSGFKGIGKNTVLAYADRPLQLSDERWKAAGVVIPLFSLRSEGSCGVGDFGDLKALVDWNVRTGLKVIQLLPIYDTTISHTWLDSYPYNSISIYALHPQYVDLRCLPLAADRLPEGFEEERARLNALPQVDYEAVNTLKTVYLRTAYQTAGAEAMNTPAYRDFFTQNSNWLLPYAAFCYLRDTNGTADFRQWPAYATYKAEEISQLCASEGPASDEIAFYCYVQFLLHEQLVEASAYARSHGVVLKGDIPIGISRNSVEAWVEPFYFNMDGQAGAPPDGFSANGQNWGFPTYNWEQMQKDDYLWWKRRFGKMAEYFDAYRIDHVLGFFRIWEIPLHSVHGLLGQFSPARPLSVDEIESYGLRFRKEYYTKPYISDWVLDAVFGERAVEVKTKYLRAVGCDWYEMLPEYDTQRKVQQAFEGVTDEADVCLREGLYKLISNVLFVPDRTNPEMYHPRIAAQQDYLYLTLGGAEREAFDALYVDYYYHRHNDFWYAEAMRKLPELVNATTMLPCAEDLGMVPDCVPWAMNDLCILTLEIQTMPKQVGLRFGCLEQNPYRSVSTIFTHDMPTLRGWWEEDTERAQLYYTQMLQKDGDAPEVMPAWLCEEVVARHLYSPSMLCLISWQDWMSIDGALRNPDVAAERINVPANPRNYWRYRMHMTLEQLMASDALNDRIHSLVAHSGRC